MNGVNCCRGARKEGTLDLCSQSEVDLKQVEGSVKYAINYLHRKETLNAKTRETTKIKYSIQGRNKIELFRLHYITENSRCSANSFYQ